MIKRFLIVLLFVLGPSICSAAEISVSNFAGGLNTQDSPAVIQPNQAQDMLNVNIQPGGASVYKRDGYGLFQNLNTTAPTEGVHGGYHFQQTGGSNVQVWASSTTLYASVGDATFVKVATGTLEATWQCTDSQGFAYCFSSSGDTPVKTDGSVANTSYFPAAPLGTMATFTPLQLVVAGVSASPNTIYISGSLAFNNFTVGILPTSPFQEPIASPGSRITHLAYYFGKLFWWKDQSFGYATFTNQNDWQMTIVSNQIGTLDNSDAFWNSSGFDSGSKFTGTAQANANSSPGGIFFRGQDNHLYVYDGYYLTRISRVISPSVTASSSRKANSWTQQTSTDFGGGSYGSSTTYSSINGGVVISTNNNNVPNNSFESGFSFGSPPGSPYWHETVINSWVNIGPGTLSYDHCTGSYANGTHAIQYPLTATAWSNMVAEMDSYPSGTLISSTSIAYASNSCTNVTRTIPASQSNARTQVYVKLYPFEFPSQTVISDSFTYSGSTLTFTTASDSSGGSAAMWIDFFQGGVDTFTGTGFYYSAVNNAPNLTSWNTFIANTQTNGGTHSFAIRSSTNTFSVLSGTPTWIAQTPGSVISASTGTYFQMEDTFTITAATQNPILQNFTFNWFEGTASDKSYIGYFNDAIWFSVSSGSTTSKNNTIFYWDLLNGAWCKYDIAANGFLIENNTLYFGSPTSPGIFQFGGVTSDNNTAINSYWRSASFLYPTGQSQGTGDIFLQKEFVQADFVLGESSTTLTYTYTLDSKTSTAYTMTAYDSAASLIQRNFLLPVGKIGKYYDFKIGDNSTNAAWRIMAHRVMYNALNWKTTLQ